MKQQKNKKTPTPLKDFENKMTSRRFIKRAYRALTIARPSQEDISRRLMRQGPFKKLIEEILPLAAFLQCFERPGLDLHCQYFPNVKNNDEQAVDARGYW